MRRPRRFIELSAGLAAVSLCLQGGLKARPPVSRRGVKTAHAPAILHVLGLQPGQGADGYVWSEPDLGCQAVLRAYDDPSLSAIAQKHLRHWSAEEPRALFQRLREQGPIRFNSALFPHPSGDDLARFCALTRWSFGNDPFDGGFKASGGGRWPDKPPSLTAIRFPALTWPVLQIVEDARAVEPPRNASEVVVYLAPTYQGTTPYERNLTREDVLSLARRWDRAGAAVAISEAEPLPLEGWFTVEITAHRRGQGRRFSRQQREFLTLNRPPVPLTSEQEAPSRSPS